MKHIRTTGAAVIIAVLLSAETFASDIFSVRTALDIGAARKSCGVSIKRGGELEFSADDLETRLELEPGSLRGVTFTSLPGAGQGKLELGGSPVEAFEFVDREGLDILRFIPEAKTVTASLTFIPRANDAVTTELMIHVTDKWKAPPELQNFSLKAIKNVAVTGRVGGFDTSLEGVSFRVVKPPNKGAVRFDGTRFTYTPYLDMSGSDKFTIRAIDSMGNISNTATVSVVVEKFKENLYYADMAGDASAYAAMKLREKNIISGWQAGDKSFFYPGRATSRGDFIVALVAASGLEDSMRPTVNTGLRNDVSIPSYLKPYIKKAMDAGIWPDDQPFVCDEIPSRAEAVTLTCRAAGLGKGAGIELSIPDGRDIPGWALPHYQRLATSGMLVLHDGVARPLDALTNAYAADLLWQLWTRGH